MPMRVLAVLLPLLLASAASAQTGPGDAALGRALVADRTQTLCLLCHALTAAGDANQGNVAPPLDGIAARLGAKGMRERIADMRRFNPATVMPPFRSTEGLRNVAPAWAGKPALTEQQLDDIVAYLATLAK
jgi:sulfur-oxidizing protein SoxX